MTLAKSSDPSWPKLEYANWRETLETLHLWSQIVGKLKLSYMPWLNHSWHAVFYVGARGFITSGVSLDKRKMQIDFDFSEHTLTVSTSDGGRESFSLESETVAHFWSHFRKSVERLGIDVHFVPVPNELTDPIPFSEDTVHRTYERQKVEDFWKALVRIDNLMQEFRTRFTGKSSPVHFFWGSFDLACTRFSGRPAPIHPGGIPSLPDLVTKEAYSDEVSSCGFWPGNAMYPHAAFYSYCYPEPKGFSSADLGADLSRAGAFYHPELREFILPYEKAIQSGSPEKTILDFFERTFLAASRLGDWPEIEKSKFLSLIQTERSASVGAGGTDGVGHAGGAGHDL